MQYDNFSDVYLPQGGAPAVCYRSGLTVYEEFLDGGVLCSGGWNTAGYPLNVLSACPSRCLDIRFGYGTGALRLPAWGIAAGTLLILLIGYAAAVFTGHWEADLPPQMIRMFLN